MDKDSKLDVKSVDINGDRIRFTCSCPTCPPDLDLRIEMKLNFFTAFFITDPLTEKRALFYRLRCPSCVNMVFLKMNEDELMSYGVGGKKVSVKIIE